MKPRGSIILPFIGLLGSLAACLEPRVYPCSNDNQCLLEGAAGSCEPPGFCAYADPTCPGSQLRFGPTAANYANDCVPPGGVAGSSSNTSDGENTSDEETTADSESDTTDPMSCGSGCTTPDGPCFEPQGFCNENTAQCEYTPKASGQPCVLEGGCDEAGVCDGAGNCNGTGTTCTNPGPCEQTPGTCNENTAECEYALRPSGSACDDGDPCTDNDTCDAQGVCVAGDGCSTDAPCQTVSCETTGCVLSPVADGTSCGPDEADRCCSGDCVDISTDSDHCGGCGWGCDPSQSCESVEDTDTCTMAPAQTSGRCTCEMSNAQCPAGQVCRNVMPFDDRCAPDAAADCPGAFVEIDMCPNYCQY